MGAVCACVGPRLPFRRRAGGRGGSQDRVRESSRPFASGLGTGDWGTNTPRRRKESLAPRRRRRRHPLTASRPRTSAAAGRGWRRERGRPGAHGRGRGAGVGSGARGGDGARGGWRRRRGRGAVAGSGGSGLQGAPRRRRRPLFLLPVCLLLLPRVHPAPARGPLRLSAPPEAPRAPPPPSGAWGGDPPLPVPGRVAPSPAPVEGNSCPVGAFRSPPLARRPYPTPRKKASGSAGGAGRVDLRPPPRSTVRPRRVRPVAPGRRGGGDKPSQTPRPRRSK